MLSIVGYALFDTAVGTCGIAWSANGVAAMHLPERDEAQMRARLARRAGAAPELPPPPQVADAIARITAVLGCRSDDDLRSIALDFTGVDAFDRRVYETARTIPPGASLTYGEVAAAMGAPGSAREVGQALGRNPFAVIVPCHRVVAARGRFGGFSTRGGVDLKLRMLANEGAVLALGYGDEVGHRR